jgi:hypothetical protein
MYGIIMICGLTMLLNVTQITILTHEMAYFADVILNGIAIQATDIRCINTVWYDGTIVTH